MRLLRRCPSGFQPFLSRPPPPSSSSLPYQPSTFSPLPTLLPLSAKKKSRGQFKPAPVLHSCASAAASGTAKSASSPAAERVQKVHTLEEFDAALRAAKNKLVEVEYTASHNANSKRIYPCMVELSRTCGDVDFLLVMGDESEQTRALCRCEGIDHVPHFTFYKAMEKIHKEEGIDPDQLVGDVLHYSDNHSVVVQPHSRADMEALINEHCDEEGKLVLLDVGLKHCRPCVKVYPTVLKVITRARG